MRINNWSYSNSLSSGTVDSPSRAMNLLCLQYILSRYSGTSDLYLKLVHKVYILACTRWLHLVRVKSEEAEAIALHSPCLFLNEQLVGRCSIPSVATIPVLSNYSRVFIANPPLVLDDMWLLWNFSPWCPSVPSQMLDNAISNLNATPYRWVTVLPSSPHLVNCGASSYPLSQLCSVRSWFRFRLSVGLSCLWDSGMWWLVLCVFCKY